MDTEYIAKLASALEEGGYLVERAPAIPGVDALLYARSPQRFRLGAAKVEDHFLFVDWGNAAFERLDQLLEIAKRFSSYTNRGFSTPHTLRMQIPNLAIVAVSPGEFPEDAARFARTKNLNPWFGGEAGQIILVSLDTHQVIHLAPNPTYRPRPGDFPLTHAVEVIEKACRRAFQESQ